MSDAAPHSPDRDAVPRFPDRDAVPFFLDCDTGVDDALAVAVLARHPAAGLVGVGTVSGNTGAVQAAWNTLGLLALAGRGDVPVAVGPPDPLSGPYAGGAPSVHGDNGIGGISLPPPERQPEPGSAADLLVALAHEYAGRLRVVATGPLTNLALALDREPALPRLLHEVTVMGGAVRVPGNVAGRGEFNIASDPPAAARTFGVRWPLTLVPLDVTMRHRFTETDREALLAAGTPLTGALGRILTKYFDHYEPVLGVRQVPLHDPLAVGIATGDIAPLDAPALGLRVEPDGRLAEDPAAPVAHRVVLSVTGEAAPLIRTLIMR